MIVVFFGEVISDAAVELSVLQKLLKITAMAYKTQVKQQNC